MRKLPTILFITLLLLNCGSQNSGGTVVTPDDLGGEDLSDLIDDSGDNDGPNGGGSDEEDDNGDEGSGDEDNTFEIPVDVTLLDEQNKRVVGEAYNLVEVHSLTADVFSSSDESIASVDASGQVQILKAGFVEITAENSVTAEVSNIEVLAKDADFSFKTWVGETDSLLDFNSTLLGLTFVSSTEEICEPIALADCGTYETEIINSSTLTDSITTLGNPGFYSFTFGSNTAATSMLSGEKFEVRSGEATVVFKDQLFLIGGYTTGDVNNPREYKNDVWVSKDGDEWLEIVEEANFSPRSGHQLLVHNDQLWLLGGSNGGTVHNDVWVTSDGKTWSEVSQQNNFGIRTHFEIFTLNNEIFLAGGYSTNGEQLDDLWHSEDGANWAVVPGFALAEASNSPVVVLGESGSQVAWLLGDKTYQSTDGLTWVEIDDAPIFTGFDNREAALINGEIWLFTYTFEDFGTHGRKNISRIYKSVDGIEWSKVNGGIYLGNLIAREAKPIAFRDRLYIVGGRAEILEYTNEVWSTTDGNLWIEHTLGGFYGPRYSHAMTSHDGRIYSVGGIASENVSTAEPRKADVWSSDDGLDWVLVEDEHPSFRARAGHALVSAGNKLCYIGGYGRQAYGTASGYRSPYTAQNPDPAGSVLHVILFQLFGVLSDVSCSIDGGTVWSEVVPSTDNYFDAREGFAAAYFNDKIWIIGGAFNSTYFADVWSTGTTASWDDRLDMFTYGAYYTEFSEVINAAPFGARKGHAVTVHNNELFLSAGLNNEGFYLDDLWKTSDGENWTLVNPDMGEMHKRAYHQMVSFDGKLWIIAGRANYHETLVDERTTVYEANDIWVSEDNGVTWTEVTEHAAFEQRQNFQALVHDGFLYITGGTGGDGYVTVQGKDSILNDVWRSQDGINWRAGFKKDMELSR